MTIAGEVNTTNVVCARGKKGFRFNAQLSHKCTLHDTSLLMIISNNSDKGRICVLTSCITCETDEREAKI